MSYQLEVQEEAWLDMEVAHDWYEEQREGLGLEFIEEVDECFSLISLDPERYGYFVGSDRYRRIKLTRFPYRVVFEVEDGRVIVMWVVHTKRDKKV